MYNDRLKRVQIDRFKDVPVEENSKLWYFWINKDGTWDSDSKIPEKADYLNIKDIFCIWHGFYRTNMFLMNKIDLWDRIKKKK